MRLLTHNTMKNNSADAKGKGFPLWITAAEVRVDDSSEPITEGQIAFVKGVLPTLEWSALVKAATEMGIPTLPPALSQELAEDEEFLKALYHILMNVHLLQGMLTCPVTRREFPVQDGIPNMMLEESECEPVRY